MSKIIHQCCHDVQNNHSITFHKCRRKGVVQDNDGKWFCTQHSPAKKLDRIAKSEAKWKAQREKERPKWRANEMLKIIRAIESGHNDPRGLCSEFIADYDKKGV